MSAAEIPVVGYQKAQDTLAVIWDGIADADHIRLGGRPRLLLPFACSRLRRTVLSFFRRRHIVFENVVDLVLGGGCRVRIPAEARPSSRCTCDLYSNWTVSDGGDAGCGRLRRSRLPKVWRKRTRTVLLKQTQPRTVTIPEADAVWRMPVGDGFSDGDGRRLLAVEITGSLYRKHRRRQKKQPGFPSVFFRRR